MNKSLISFTIGVGFGYYIKTQEPKVLDCVHCKEREIRHYTIDQLKKYKTKNK